ncbi:MAG: nucleotide sugar dehydrogenase [Chlamydiota bacterium]
MTTIFRLAIVCFLGAVAPCISQNVTVVGIGRLGLSYALCLEQVGHHVIGVDVDPNYIEQINSKTLCVGEPGINEMLRNSHHFRATTSLREAMDFADTCLIVVSTTIGTEGYNFSALTGVLSEINALKVANKHLVINSTLFPGFVQNTANALLADCANITLSYNPPFIAQGEIVKGLVAPDMVLIGQASEEAGDIIESLHHSIHQNEPHIVRMSVESAEITKLALNCYVTAKVAFANLVGDIADETPGANKYDILSAIGCDSRVGSKYLRPGYGFGGPCFVRDNLALADYADLIGIDPVTFRATDEANEQHAVFMADKFVEMDLEEYVFEDVSYKPNCPVKIIYASQKLAVAKLIAERGRRVTIVDVQSVIDEVRSQYGDLFHYVTQ